MDNELIYIKTAAGEEAIRDRTRLVQRNLRMVLILVDGLTNVGTLKQKAGEASVIEAALSELERIGLIESIEVRTHRRAHSISDALPAVEPEYKVEPTASATDDADALAGQADTPQDFAIVDTVFEALTPSETERHDPPDIRELDVEILESADIDRDREPHSSPASPSVRPAAANNNRKSEASSTADPKRGGLSTLRDRWTHMREEQTYERAYGRTHADAPVTISRRKSRPGRMLGWMLILALFATIGWVVLYPYNEYRSEFEDRLAELLGAGDVSIANVTLTMFPRPGLQLENVRIGSNVDASIRSILLEPGLTYFIGDEPIAKATIIGASVREPLIARLRTTFPEGVGRGWLPKQILFEDLTVKVGSLESPPVSGELLLASTGGIEEFSGKSGNVEVSLASQTGSIHLRVFANSQGSLPTVPSFPYSALDMDAKLLAGQLQIERLDVRAFDGLISGKGTLGWQPESRLALDLTLQHVNASKVLGAFSGPGLLDGLIDGKLRYGMSAVSAAWLGKGAQLDGQFTVSQGVLDRIDLAGALRSSGNKVLRGGESRFENLSARVLLSDESIKFSGAKLNSGLLTALGQMSFPRKDGTIAGTANVTLRGGESIREAAVAISGVASAPEIKIVR